MKGNRKGEKEGSRDRVSPNMIMHLLQLRKLQLSDRLNYWERPGITLGLQIRQSGGTKHWLVRQVLRQYSGATQGYFHICSAKYLFRTSMNPSFKDNMPLPGLPLFMGWGWAEGDVRALLHFNLMKLLLRVNILPKPVQTLNLIAKAIFKNCWMTKPR